MRATTTARSSFAGCSRPDRRDRRRLRVHARSDAAEISSGKRSTLVFAQAYYGNFLLGNQMNQLANSEAARHGNDRVIIEGAIVSVTDSATGAQVRPAFSTPATGFVDPVKTARRRTAS